MVYHNLSMSLNHHVPIFICTVTEWGGLLLFTYMWVAITNGAVASVEVFLYHELSIVTILVLFMSGLTPPPVTSPVLGHVTLLYHLGASVAHPLFLYVLYTTNALHKIDTWCRQKLSEQETQPWSSCSCLLLSHSVWRPNASISSFLWSKINLLLVSHECKDYSCDLKDNPLYSFQSCLTLETLCLHSYLKKCNVCFLAQQPSQITGYLKWGGQ